MRVRLAGRAGLLAALMLLTATPGLACEPSAAPSPSPSSGGMGGGDTGNNNNGSDGGRRVNPAAQGAMQGAMNGAAQNLDGGDSGGSRRSGGAGGDQQAGNYTSQIDSLAAGPAQGAMGGMCAVLEAQVQSDQQMLFAFDTMHSSEASQLKSNQQALNNLNAGVVPKLSQAEIDQQLVLWTQMLQTDERAHAKAMVAYFGQLKLTGAGDTSGLISYYQGAVNAGQAQAAESAAQRQPLVEKLQASQRALAACKGDE